MDVEDDPLVGPPPAEVPLTNAPLVRVIAQVRFPEIAAVGRRDFVAPFQEAIRSTYPVGKREQTQGIVVVPQAQGLAQTQPEIAWRFGNVEGTWRVSVAPQFLALETTSYTSRGDFIDRLRTVVEALDEHVNPSVVQRFGLRYITRVTGDALTKIGTLVRPEVTGIVATPVSQHARHSLTESLFDLPGNQEQLLGRWGRIPAGGTVDPNAIEPINAPSWILDIDMFSNEQRMLTPDQVTSDARRYAERIYTVFRWAVTDDFLHHYGGRP